MILNMVKGIKPILVRSTWTKKRHCWWQRIAIWRRIKTVSHNAISRNIRILRQNCNRQDSLIFLQIVKYCIMHLIVVFRQEIMMPSITIIDSTSALAMSTPFYCSQTHFWRIDWQACPSTPLGPGIPIVLYFIICTTRQLKAKEVNHKK